jgi:hypothetical protein
MYFILFVRKTVRSVKLRTGCIFFLIFEILLQKQSLGNYLD